MFIYRNLVIFSVIIMSFMWNDGYQLIFAQCYTEWYLSKRIISQSLNLFVIILFMIFLRVSKYSRLFLKMLVFHRYILILHYVNSTLYYLF